MSAELHPGKACAERVFLSLQRDNWLLAGMLAASVALHVAAIAIVPDPAPVKSERQALEVLLVQPPALLSAPAPAADNRETPRQAVKPKTAEQRRPPSIAELPAKAMRRENVLALPEAAPVNPPPLSAPTPTTEATPAPEPSPKVAAGASAPSPPSQEVIPTVPPNFSAAYLRNPQPRYPLAARRSGIEGTVRLKVLVTREGRAALVEVDRTSGSATLDGAAVEAVRTWQFVPARRGQDSVESWVLVPVVFKLESAG